MTLKELQKILNKEYDNLVQRGLDWSIENDENEHVYFLNRAYEYAHYNEILDYFENMDEEQYEADWAELIDEKSAQGMIEGVYKSWLDYWHPERYNFFCYEDLVDIIKNYLRNC